MAYFKDVHACETHGFALSPEGKCVRCVSEAASAARRLRFMKLGTGGAVLLTSLCGVGVVRARMANADPSVAPMTQMALTANGEIPVCTKQEAPVVAATPGVDPSDQAWEAAIAKNDALHATEAQQEAAAEKRRLASATTLPVSVPTPTRAIAAAPAPAPVTPGVGYGARYMPTYNHPVGTRTTSNRVSSNGFTPSGSGFSNSAVTWGTTVPANNGGNFGNHRGGVAGH